MRLLVVAVGALQDLLFEIMRGCVRSCIIVGGGGGGGVVVVCTQRGTKEGCVIVCGYCSALLKGFMERRRTCLGNRARVASKKTNDEKKHDAGASGRNTNFFIFSTHMAAS